MGHRPYPNADRTRRYVDARHGSCCPQCGHYASVHPYEHGQFVCSRTRDGLPSCRECSARLMQLRNSPLAGFAKTTTRIHINVPQIAVPSAPSVLAVQSAMASLRQVFPRRV